jgi:hypothetical protein
MATLEIWDSQSKVEYILPATVAKTTQLPVPSAPTILSTPEVPKTDKRRSAKQRAGPPKGAKKKPTIEQRTLEIEVGRAKLEDSKITADPSQDEHPGPDPKSQPAERNSPEDQ